jgi:hypothetical protein
MTSSNRISPLWVWFTLPITLLVLWVSIAGLTDPSIYSGSAAWRVQGQAQDLVDAVVVLPLLVGAAAFTARGSWRARSLWLASLAYLLYSFVIYSFAVPFNRVFLCYVAVLGCSLWALIGGLTTVDWVALRARFDEQTPRKPIALFLGILALLFLLMWLSEDIPAMLAGVAPQSVFENGLLTNPIHVLDLSILLPAMITTAVLLWRRHPLGYGLAAMLLAVSGLESVGIATIFGFSLLAGLPGNEVLLAVFVILALAAFGCMAWYLHHFNESPSE